MSLPKPSFFSLWWSQDSPAYHREQEDWWSSVPQKGGKGGVSLGGGKAAAQQNTFSPLSLPVVSLWSVAHPVMPERKRSG